MKNIPEERGGFIVILYMLFHVKDVYAHPEFNSATAQKFRKDYSQDKLQRICKGLSWALDNRDYDFQNVFPKMKHSNRDILFFFEKTYNEMKAVGLCDECSF